MADHIPLLREHWLTSGRENRAEETNSLIWINSPIRNVAPSEFATIVLGSEIKLTSAKGLRYERSEHFGHEDNGIFVACRHVGRVQLILVAAAAVAEVVSRP